MIARHWCSPAKRAWRALLFALAGGSSSILPASTIIAPSDDASITAQMYRDEAALYPSVGKVSGSGFSGSGVLIGGQWVLTAGHVALSKTNGSFLIGGRTMAVDRAIVHPSFSFTGPINDIGLLHLAAPVTNVAPAVMLSFANPASILGREATWVGHGMTGTGLTGYQSTIEFRAFTNVIDTFGNNPNYGLPSTSFVADFDRPDGSTNAAGSSPTATRLEGCVAPGDSGGGVFIHPTGGAYLIGINSYLARFDNAADADYGDLSGGTRLDLYFPWILEQTGILAVPEPSLPVLGLFGLALVLRRRR